MSKPIMDLVAAAKQAVTAITPEEVKPLLDRDDVLIVDVRDDNEVAESGKVKGAVHVSRGMLEFRADETTPFHNVAFAKDKTIILYLRIRRAVRPGRHGASRSRLWRCSQSRCLQGLGRGRRRRGLTSPPSERAPIRRPDYDEGRQDWRRAVAGLR